MTLKDYADEYAWRGLTVFPFHKKYEPDLWTLWRIAPKKTYFRLLEDYPWKKARGLRAVMGKDNVRAVLICKWEWTGRKFMYKCLEKALELLGLPSDYEWVIDNNHYYAILVKTKENIKLPNSSEDGITFIWEGTMVVPPGQDWKIWFINKFRWGFPKTYRPLKTLEAKYVVNCVLELRKITAWYKREKPKKKPFLVSLFHFKMWSPFCKNLLLWFIIVLGMFLYIYIPSSLLAVHKKNSPFVISLIAALVVSVFMFQGMPFDEDDGRDLDKYFK